MAVWKVSLGALVLAGCALAPRARPITAPDGAPALHVACSGDPGACFELAGRSCPAGYRIAPVFANRDDSFLVRCAASAATAPAFGGAAGADAVRDWPPPAESWPTPNPWSTASNVPPVASGLGPPAY